MASESEYGDHAVRLLSNAAYSTDPQQALALATMAQAYAILSLAQETRRGGDTSPHLGVTLSTLLDTKDAPHADRDT